MSTIFDIPLEEIIRTRISVRTYSGKSLPRETREKISSYMGTLSNPFGVKVTFRLLESKKAMNAEKLGTYGFIKGAEDYIGATVREEEFSLEALGYEFEKLVLYITSMGLGTCWLGGSFHRGEFAKAMSVRSDEIFPVISPVGFAADKRSLTDSIVRFLAKGDLRKSWDELFFNKNFSTPLSGSEAGVYEKLFEMVRIAPSASNKQPWRVVKDGNKFHFYEYKTPRYTNAFGYDIQRIDIGIAACHFHLMAIEKNLEGAFKKLANPINDVPEDALYIFSWISK